MSEPTAVEEVVEIDDLHHREHAEVVRQSGLLRDGGREAEGRGEDVPVVFPVCRGHECGDPLVACAESDERGVVEDRTLRSGHSDAGTSRVRGVRPAASSRHTFSAASRCASPTVGARCSRR